MCALINICAPDRLCDIMNAHSAAHAKSDDAAAAVSFQCVDEEPPHLLQVMEDFWVDIAARDAGFFVPTPISASGTASALEEPSVIACHAGAAAVPSSGSGDTPAVPSGTVGCVPDPWHACLQDIKEQSSACNCGFVDDRERFHNLSQQQECVLSSRNLLPSSRG